MKIEVLNHVAIGLPITRQGISFLPIYLMGNKLPPITTGPDSGLEIKELDQASIPTLKAVNPTDKPVLVVEGEHWLGGKQNRAINATILVPANSELKIPVSCLERGRWSKPLARYKRSSSFAPRRVRQDHGGFSKPQCCRVMAGERVPRRKCGIQWEWSSKRLASTRLAKQLKIYATGMPGTPDGGPLSKS